MYLDVDHDLNIGHCGPCRGAVPEFSPEDDDGDPAEQHGSAESSAADVVRLYTKYWHQLCSFVRRRGFTFHEAEDLTQSFFVQLLRKDAFRKLAPLQGNPRSYLMTGLRFFLANEWDKTQTVKRGGDFQIVSLDAMTMDGSNVRDQFEPAAPDDLFDVYFAWQIISKVRATLRAEYKAEGKIRLFKTLEKRLADNSVRGLHKRRASTAGMNPGAFRVALHRFRRRFGELLRNEIAGTAGNNQEMNEEIRSVFLALTA